MDYFVDFVLVCDRTPLSYGNTRIEIKISFIYRDHWQEAYWTEKG